MALTFGVGRTSMKPISAAALSYGAFQVPVRVFGMFCRFFDTGSVEYLSQRGCGWSGAVVFCRTGKGKIPSASTTYAQRPPRSAPELRSDIPIPETRPRRPPGATFSAFHLAGLAPTRKVLDSDPHCWRNTAATLEPGQGRKAAAIRDDRWVLLLTGNAFLLPCGGARPAQRRNYSTPLLPRRAVR